MEILLCKFLQPNPVNHFAVCHRAIILTSHRSIDTSGAEGDGYNFALVQTVNVCPGMTYVWSFWASSNGSCLLVFGWDNENAQFQSVNSLEWQLLSFVSPPTTDGATQIVFAVESFFPCINATYFDNFMAIPYQ
jgi:hypothetical protein